jgi:hypothetical protein
MDKSFDEVIGLNKLFKEKLPIQDKSWLGIGKHIGGLVKDEFERRNIVIEDFPLSDTIIPSSYLNDYLSGISSFGCFFRQIKDYCELGLEEIFDKQSNPDENDLGNLLKYLGSVSYESFVPLLAIKSGKELREHLSEGIHKAREGIFQGNENDEKDFVTRYLIDRKSKESPEQAWNAYQGCLSGKIPDGRIVHLAVIFGISVETLIPLIPFDKWGDSMKFEMFNRMQLNGVGPVCGTKIVNSDTVHVNASELTDIEHYETSLSLMPYFYLMQALPILTED